MKAVLVFGLTVIAVAVAAPPRLGICVEMCGVGNQCPTGYHCASNGCGHTCQKTNIILGQKQCNNIHMALCDLWCPNGAGFAHDENGCPLCKCDNSNILAINK